MKQVRRKRLLFAPANAFGKRILRRRSGQQFAAAAPGAPVRNLAGRACDEHSDGRLTVQLLQTLCSMCVTLVLVVVLLMYVKKPNISRSRRVMEAAEDPTTAGVKSTTRNA